ncbi:hemolysin secretion protein D [Methylopila jiangsuensis]|uniref:Hemolysin secretion protein D n=1 Tax=Methylopila jiangsuensis TaxID=586230 RepID=A0A9W6N231_9HYPH|nr:efflux RND transporter periplasmic adaptor subunit [Methylopila jiangsuensis]MDR6287224.1 HlyD family secretion protein [Methylopila jiangsuensis]GLK74816.1 hemolysin secretion protein D [Methylopila jiangsuensis]
MTPSRPRRLWPKALALTLIAAGVAAYAFRDDLLPAGPATPTEASATARPSAIAVTVAPVIRREIVQKLALTGTLAARDEILVGAQIDGLRLEAYLVETGDRVEAGQTLARLDRDMLDVALAQNRSTVAKADAAVAQAGAAIAEADAARVEAEAALKRAQQLKSSGNVTGETLQARETAAQVAVARLRAQGEALKLAEADKALAEAQGREIELRLARTEVKAPAAGVVSARTARVGQIVGMGGEPLFRLVRDGAIELVARVPETRLPGLKPGQPVRVEVAGLPDPVWGRVRLVEPVVDAVTRLGLVRVALPDEPDLRAGLFARAAVETARRQALAAPRSAVLYGAQGARVLAVRDGVVAELPVTLGVSDADGVEIADGVTAGETLVARAGGFLRDGDRVLAVAPEAPARPQKQAATEN